MFPASPRYRLYFICSLQSPLEIKQCWLNLLIWTIGFWTMAKHAVHGEVNLTDLSVIRSHFYLHVEFYSLLSLSLSVYFHSKQGSGTDFLFHGYQQVVIQNLICCTVTAHYSFLYCRLPYQCPTPSLLRWLLGRPPSQTCPQIGVGRGFGGTGPGCSAVYCTRDHCWHRGVECTMWSVVVLLNLTFARLQKCICLKKTLW